MTTRVQVFRTPTTGVAPAAGSRASGELWVNFADFQLGMIDASKNAQKLIAVRFFSTTANYAAGDFAVQAGKLYVATGAVAAGVFNSGQWSQIASSSDLTAALAAYLPLTGGTLTGALVLAADPGAALGAATKQYVDGKVTAAPYLPLAGGTMLAPITLSGPPTIPLHAVTKAYVDSGAFVPIAGGTMTGPLTLAADPAAPLQPATKQYTDARDALALPRAGVTNGSDAASGQIGEVISNLVTQAAAISMTTATWTQITSITLTPGDWDIHGEADVNNSTAAAMSGCFGAISLSPTTPSAGPTGVNQTTQSLQVSYNSGGMAAALRPCRASVAASTIYYLLAYGAFTSGTAKACGLIWARRAR